PRLYKLRDELLGLSDKIIEKVNPFLKDLKLHIENNLKDLNMENSKIDWKIEKLKEPRKDAAHKITFLLKTNPKSDFMPLAEIASGGELSRIILAVEVVLGKNHAIDTMVFDEIDSGVGPRMADVVGNKLNELSKDKQIIVITHMPQVANFATEHFKIVKSLNEETTSTIVKLSENERLEEIKEMYGNIVY
ncbi:MAG: DNA repair protein RecN, partial [Petrotoga mobilis]